MFSLWSRKLTKSPNKSDKTSVGYKMSEFYNLFIFLDSVDRKQYGGVVYKIYFMSFMDIQ